jgi:3-methylfumaryl-CoA hydratase
MMENQPIPEVGEQLFSEAMRPGTLDLFLYGAAAWITHRSHYDHEFARSEGHEGVLVHGPLQGAYLMERLHQWSAGRGGRLRHIKYRDQAPIIADTPIVLSAVVEAVETLPEGTALRVAVAIDKASGERCTSGTAHLVFDGTTPGAR